MLSWYYLQTPGCFAAKNSKKHEFCFFAAVVEKNPKKPQTTYLRSLICFCRQLKDHILRGFNDLWGLLRACCIASKKNPKRTGFIPEILPVCRCVVSAQQQCFAKLQSEMNQLAQPPACQPSHPEKTNDRGPLLLFHNSYLYILFLCYLL